MTRAKTPCEACGKSSQRIANLKISVAVSKSKDMKIFIGDFLCSRCAAIPLENADSFYDYMSKEHRLAQSDEQMETGTVDDSLNETGGGSGSPVKNS